jgi:mevalonate kinase
MPGTLTASAPGKLILAGEHAVVYGRPALVAAVDLRLAATVVERPERRPRTVRLEVPRLAVAEEVPWPRVLEVARAARERWRAWAAGGGEGGFAAPRGGDAGHVVEVALGEAAHFLDQRSAPGGGERHPPPSLDLRIDSALPLGSGFGSSAAVAVAVAAAYLALRGAEATTADIEGIAREVERRQHGLPSGVDAATVLHGGVLWAERGGDGCLQVEPFDGRSPLLRELAVFDTGTPAEGTGAVVAAVRDRFAADRRRSEAVWGGIEAATRGLRALLEETAGGEDARRRLVASIRACQAGLEELGVVPAPVREIVRRVEAEGGAAKVSGAGALTGEGAGSLIVAHADPAAPSRWPFLSSLTRYPVVLGGPGLRVERVSEPPR